MPQQKAASKSKSASSGGGGKPPSTSLPTSFEPEQVGTGGNFKNRIIGDGMADPTQLLANPKNWRIHPKAQQDTLKGVLEQVGWVQRVIVNQRTGFVVDGHLRVALALREEEPSIPVSYVDLSDSEEAIILATFDMTTGMAGMDPDKTLDLISEVRDRISGPAIHDALDALKERAEKLKRPEQREEEMTKAVTNNIFALQDDVIFDSDNEWGIPNLLPDKLGTLIPSRTWNGKEDIGGRGADYLFVWGKPVPPDAASGTLCLYVEDEHFERAWTDAVDVVADNLDFGWAQIVVPDFSLWRDDPLVIQLMNKYKSQWVARYWQEAGFNVIPNLSWSDTRTHKWIRAGLPDTVPVAATQCRTLPSMKAKQLYISGLRTAIEQVQPKDVIVYGGVLNRDWLESELPHDVPTRFHFLQSWTGARIETGVVKKRESKRRGG